jgi:hypothetical protein
MMQDERESRKHFDARFDSIDRRFDRIDATLEKGLRGVRAQFRETRDCLQAASDRTCAHMDEQFARPRADLGLKPGPK